MLSGVILLPTKRTEIEQIKFPKTNLLYYSVPYNTTKLCDYCFNFCKDISYMFVPSFTKSISDKSFISVKRLWLYYEYSPWMTTITRFLPVQTGLYKLTADSVKKIEESAFQGCTNLTLASLPGGVTYIGAWGFHDCTSLALTSLPAALTEIGESAFSGCINLALTELPQKLVIIGDSAFESCTGITEMSIPDSVQEIGDRAFFGCSLQHVRIRNEFRPDVQRIFGDVPIVFDFY